jgi:predicted Holliday junction resolvase-like endonuclease
MNLQDTFYIMAIVYMSLMFLLMIVTLIVILVIKHKIHLIQRNIEEKLSAVTNAVHIGEAIVDKAKDAFKKK